jgi:hypothetical protein
VVVVVNRDEKRKEVVGRWQGAGAADERMGVAIEVIAPGVEVEVELTTTTLPNTVTLCCCVGVVLLCIEVRSDLTIFEFSLPPPPPLSGPRFLLRRK